MRSKPTKIFIQVKKERWIHKQKQVRCHFEMETYESFGFVPNLSLSIHLNACNMLGSTTLECYFQHSTNKTFHDPTEGRSLPAAAMSIIRMGMKFIPMPAWTPSEDSIEASIDCFERDIGLKVYFAGDNEDKEVKKLRIKLIW